MLSKQFNDTRGDKLVFSSSIFLFCFLPLVLLFYYNPLNKTSICSKLLFFLVTFAGVLCYLMPYRLHAAAFMFLLPAGIFLCSLLLKESAGNERSTRNIILLCASLIFYAWGEPVYIVLLLLSIVVNWFLGLLVVPYSNTKTGRWIVALAVLLNVSVFFVFKYMGFVFKNLEMIGVCDLPTVKFILPIGISFYTFQALSYVIDVYRGDAACSKNPLDVGLYIALFPQLIAGPIVRYNSIAKELTCRNESMKNFASGAVRFTTGLGKKMIIANPCAYVADMAFDAAPGELTTLLAWMGAIAYTFQIYFDFSGYSDMAIGLGRMFGFHFLENFNFPYIARSITDFWRRWHISLSTWFRDYVYIPLGGNRGQSQVRIVFNLFVVWMLTGIWHGANWTFICWGLFYFILLMFERFTGLNKKMWRFGWLYTMPCVILAWVLFRATDISSAGLFIAAMIGINDTALFVPNNIFILGEYAPFLLLGTVFSLPILPYLRRKSFYIGRIRNRRLKYVARQGVEFASFVAVLGVFLLSVSFVVKSTNNPFIYFNF